MSTLRVTTLQNLRGTEVYTCKAWVNFNGTGTVAIRASGNVSSITDNGTGDYTVNFTTAMIDANYSAVVLGSSSATGGGGNTPWTVNSVGGGLTAFQSSGYRFYTKQSTTLGDTDLTSVAIFR